MSPRAKEGGHIILLLLMLLSLGWAAAGAEALMENPKKVLLTFDDGPHPRYTPPVLAILEENHVQGVFFVVGREAAKYPDLLKRIVHSGHVIGNHTYSHRVIKGMDEVELAGEISLTDTVIEGITGQTTEYFRPPLGAYNFREALMVKQAGKTVLMWDLGLESRAAGNAEELVDRLLQRIGRRQEVILLLHDGTPDDRHQREVTLEALPLLIRVLEKKGYQFVDPCTPEGRAFMESFGAAKPKMGVY